MKYFKLFCFRKEYVVEWQQGKSFLVSSLSEPQTPEYPKFLGQFWLINQISCDVFLGNGKVVMEYKKIKHPEIFSFK